jgi:hypothetical protein
VSAPFPFLEPKGSTQGLLGAGQSVEVQLERGVDSVTTARSATGRWRGLGRLVDERRCEGGLHNPWTSFSSARVREHERAVEAARLSGTSPPLSGSVPGVQGVDLLSPSSSSTRSRSQPRAQRETISDIRTIPQCTGFAFRASPRAIIWECRSQHPNDPAAAPVQKIDHPSYIIDSPIPPYDESGGRSLHATAICPPHHQGDRSMHRPGHAQDEPIAPL